MNWSVDVRVVDDVHAVGIWGRTLIQIWRGPPSGPATAEVNRIARRLLVTASSRATSLFIVEAGSPPPDGEGRKNMAEFSKEIAGQMPLAVVVAEGGSFRSALVRAVGLTLSRLLPHSGTFQFVNDLETGAKLIEPHLHRSAGGAEQLVEAAEDLRSRIGKNHIRR